MSAPRASAASGLSSGAPHFTAHCSLCHDLLCTCVTLNPIHCPQLPQTKISVPSAAPIQHRHSPPPLPHCVPSTPVLHVRTLSSVSRSHPPSASSSLSSSPGPRSFAAHYPFTSSRLRTCVALFIFHHQHLLYSPLSTPSSLPLYCCRAHGVRLPPRHRLVLRPPSTLLAVIEIFDGVVN